MPKLERMVWTREDNSKWNVDGRNLVVLVDMVFVVLRIVRWKDLLYRT